MVMPCSRSARRPSMRCARSTSARATSSAARRIQLRRMHDPRELAAVFAGGTAGALARAGVAEALPVHPGQWPWATFLVNVAGALALGYFTTRLQERLPQSAYRRPLLGTGFCGGLTTFSTMQVELLGMLDAGDLALAAAYALASVACGFLAVAAATNLVRRARVTG